jgi:hypothetical protein
MTVTIDGNGPITGLTSQSFDNSSGVSIPRPQFMASAQWGAWNHNFTTSNNTAYTGLSGFQSYMAFNLVGGINTTGFLTSTTPGVSRYQAPLTGVYAMSFMHLVNSAITNHVDTAWIITDAADTYRATLPWQQQTVQSGPTDFGTCGHTRMHIASGTGSGNDYGHSALIRLFEGQIIRPYITLNATVTLSMFGAAHNFWHGTYIGA